MNKRSSKLIIEHTACKRRRKH